MPLLLAPLALLGVGGLVWKTVTDDTADAVERTAPNLAVLAALALAGYAVWHASRR